MAVVPRSRPLPPFVAPSAGTLDERMAIVAQAINRKVDANTTPTFPSIYLQATDGSVWRLTVQTSGALLTDRIVP